MYTSVRERVACAIKGTHDLWPCIWNHKENYFWLLHGLFELYTLTLSSYNDVGVGVIRRSACKAVRRCWRHLRPEAELTSFQTKWYSEQRNHPT